MRAPGPKDAAWRTDTITHTMTPVLAMGMIIHTITAITTMGPAAITMGLWIRATGATPSA